MNTEIMVLGGGCFWCTEAVCKQLRGVIEVLPGYAGGTTANPNYYAVATGRTGHAEVIQVTFDPEQVSYRDLLEVFFSVHDPTTLNRQGADTGTEYRSIILYTSEAQREAARGIIKELTQAGAYGSPIVTEVKALEKFYEAEEEHKDFYKKYANSGYCQVVINPKLKKFKEKFSNLLKKDPA